MSQYTGATPGTPRAADWRDVGLCRDEDPELFFPVGGGVAAKAQIRQAKLVCFRCPSKQACGAWALQTRQGFGVWGGMSEGERRAILRRNGVRLPSDPDVAEAKASA
ncbi:WhiB family transcriptional regulator [Streptomyces sp. NPDC048200]|uniref:WhiB family transcriptional regulator n=1 Tax=Streptomyces sp. NPDC048200 TaxID=3365512 RepID=UPI0037186A36